MRSSSIDDPLSVLYTDLLKQSAVNPAYRLGGFGFFASDELLAEGEPANAGLLDSRLAYDWVKTNIAQLVLRLDVAHDHG